jgi:integrase
VRQILTDTRCKTRPPRSGRLEIADMRQVGLVLRVTANGARTFAFRFRHPHTRKTLRLTIGSYPTTSLEAARKRAHEMATQVEAGANPIEVRRDERNHASERTFGHLADRYLKEYAERHKRPRSAEEDRRNLAVHILPKWEERDFRTIRRDEIVALIESIIAAGKHAAANRVHTLISGIFRFAIDAGLLEANPAARLKKRGVEQPRRRVLDDAELATFWNKIVLSPVSRPVGLALRLALITAARANEIAGAHKAEFQNLDSTEPAWIIPGGRVKNGRDHLVPLSPLAVETIRAAIDLTSPDDEFVFPTRLGRRGPIDRHTLSMAMARFGKDLKGPAAKTWQKEMPSPHDLRRTVATRLAGMEIQKEIRERVLNHTGSRRRDTEAEHYNAYEFAKEKRAALDRWATEIGTLIKPAKVIPMPVKRRR